LEQPLQAIAADGDAIRAKAQDFAPVIVGGFLVVGRGVGVIVGHSENLSG